MEGGSVKIPFWPNQVWAESLQQRAAYSALFFLLFLNSRRVGGVEVPTLACYKTRKLLENRKDPPVRASGLNWALSACIAKECDFDGFESGFAPWGFVVRLPPLYTPVRCKYRPKAFPLARQAHTLEAPVGRHPPLPLYTMAVSAIRIPPSFLHMPYFIRPRWLPLGGFPPLWLNQSRPSMRLSMTPQRLGRPRYH